MRFPKKIWFYSCLTGLIILNNTSYGKAIIRVKNFCNQPVTLHASDDIECEPSGKEIEPKHNLRELDVNTSSIAICYPRIDDGQSTYYMHVEQQQEPPGGFTPETAGLREGGTLFWYCSNSGPTGPCQCVIDYD